MGRMAAGPHRCPGRVLVIDDDPLSLHVLALQLHFEGYQVTASPSGEHALRMLGLRKEAVGGDLQDARHPEDSWAETPVPALQDPLSSGPLVVDLLLVDLRMPGLAGSALAAELREATGDAPLIAMSATRPEPEELSDFDGFLLKPLDLGALAEYLAHLAAVRGARGGGADSAMVGPLASLGDLGFMEDERPEEAPIGGEFLDGRIYANLQRAMPPAAVRELIAACVGDARARGATMRSAGTLDLELVRREAHAVKGGAGMVGARQLAEVAAGIELGSYQSKDLELMLVDLFEACDVLERKLLK